jgi:hypothetical protein
MKSPLRMVVAAGLLCLGLLVLTTAASQLADELGTPFADLVRPGDQQPLESLLKTWDVDGDGYLTADDLAAIYERYYGHDMYSVDSEDTALVQQMLNEAIQLWQHPLIVDPADASRLSLKGIIAYIRHTLAKYYPVTPIEEIHLALTGDPTTMSVSWLTPDKPTTAVVHYGLTPDNLNLTVTGNINHYQIHNPLLGLLGFGYIYTGWTSQATMVGIPAEATIYYSCSNGVDASPVNSFRAAASQSHPTRLAALGDQGPFFPAGFKVTEQIAALPDLDLVLHAGDLAYAGTSGSADGKEIEQVWDWWGRQNQQFSATVPYMLTVGNHEQFYNYTSFIHRFHMPQNGNGNFWYSYDVGYFHILSFSSEHPYSPGTPQYEFIVNDLATAAARTQQVPWLLAIDHRPFYCSDQSEWGSNQGNPATSQLSAYLEPLFNKYGVNVVISGHMHVFERTYPVNLAVPAYSNGANHYNATDPPVYITVGSGGIFLDLKWIQPAPAWSAYRISAWGVAILEANATSLHYEFQTALDRRTKDEFWISQ